MEHRRLDVVPLLAVAPATGPELGPLLLAQLDVLEDAVQLLLRDLRSLLRLGVEGVADLFLKVLVFWWGRLSWIGLDRSGPSERKQESTRFVVGRSLIMAVDIRK